MDEASLEVSRCPPGREGAYASLSESGYRAVRAAASHKQMATFSRRAIAFHGGAVEDEEALGTLAQEHFAQAKSYQELLVELNGFAWISWPGQGGSPRPPVKRQLSTHLPTPTHCGHDEALEFFPDVSASTLSADFATQPGPDLAGGASAPEEAVSDAAAPCPDSDKLAEPAPSGSCFAVRPSAPQALQDTHEVHMDSSELCSQPFHDFGALVVTAPPWRPQHLLQRRLFSLVLRNPRDRTRGLVLMSSPDQLTVKETAEGILHELDTPGSVSAAALADPVVYDALNYDPALLAAVATSVSQSGALGMHQLFGDIGSSGVGSAGSASSTEPSAPPAASSTEPSAPPAAVLEAAPATEAVPPEEAAGTGAVHPEEEVGECPICFDAIQPGAAAMRCSGAGGRHHYFHAACLQQWIRSCRAGHDATCPVCRERLQFNGRRIDEFLQGDGSASLEEEDRSFLRTIADGLQHRNEWSDMTTLEKTAYTGGIMAAAGWGFLLGFTERHHRTSELLLIQHIPREHQVAEGVGWVAGLLVRVIRDAMKDRDRDRNRHGRC